MQIRLKMTMAKKIIQEEMRITTNTDTETTEDDNADDADD